MARQNLGCILRPKAGASVAPVCTMTTEEIPVPTPQAGEVLLEIKVVGVSGSDVQFWQKGRVGDFEVGDALVPGHQAAGRVVELGPGVSHLRVGDRVAIEPGRPCGVCTHCKAGHYNVCPEMQFWGTPPSHGALQTYVTMAASNCFRLPPNVSYETAALLEPLSIGIHACRRTGVTVGSKVLVVGAGPIGLLCLLAARAFGARAVAVADVRAGRLELAAQCGADRTIEVSSLESSEASEGVGPTDLKSLLDDRPDIAMECSGTEAGLAIALQVAAACGKVVNVGCCPYLVRVPFAQASSREVDVLGLARYRNTWPLAIDMVSSGKVSFQSLITHRFRFDKPGDVERAFECAGRRRDDDGNPAFKVMISVTPDDEPDAEHPAGEVAVGGTPRVATPGSLAVPLHHWGGPASPVTSE